MTPKEKTWRTHLLLQEKYGKLPLKPRRKPMHELISTMISHRTTQAQEDRAFHQMWDHFGHSWKAIMDAPMEEIADTLSPARWPGQKAQNIKRVLKAIYEREGDFNIDFLKEMGVDEALEWLTGLPGVGMKTASLVLLFCFAKPVLPVDTHVHRVSLRLGLIPEGTSAEKAHTLLQDMLPKDAEVLFNFHIHLLWHGQRVCTWATPKHGQCPLTDFCSFYRNETKGPKKAKTKHQKNA